MTYRFYFLIYILLNSGIVFSEEILIQKKIDAPSSSPKQNKVESSKFKQKMGLQGEPCHLSVCDKGLSCIKYYGIAGPSIPPFTSCEIPCKEKGDVCPKLQRCQNIVDGPGKVCRKVFIEVTP
ncbi:MAG: hypothetical protein EXR74_00120 [Bdellovibrionales bacterium]|nr:hypothetical protein [Bdellovibrionales bacterium]